MFDLFRSRDKIVRIMLGGLLLVVALSMLTYLVPSYNMGGSGGSDQVVAEIGKEAITVPEVQQIVQMNMKGRQLPAELMPHYVPQFINSMVTERALAFEARRLGFKVSEEDLAAGIRQMIPQLFPDGKFAGKEAYAQVLAQQNMSIPQFEEDMARQLLITKMRNVALEGTVVTPQEIEQEYRRRNDKVKIQYVKITGDKLRSEVQVAPDELRKYYEANKAAYQVPEKRDLGIKAALERDVRLVQCEDGKLVIGLEPSAPSTLVQDLSKKLALWTGRRWMVAVSAEQGAPTMRAQADAQKAELVLGVRSDPLVQAVLAKFPGAEIVGVSRREPDVVATAPLPPAEPDQGGDDDADDF